MSWNHTYREGEVPPGGTITGSRPGYKIAQAITEIQDKVIKEVELETTDGIEGSAVVVGNKLILQIGQQPSETPDDEVGDSFPVDGEDGMYLRYSPDGNHYWDYIRAIST